MDKQKNSKEMSWLKTYGPKKAKELSWLKKYGQKTQRRCHG